MTVKISAMEKPLKDKNIFLIFLKIIFKSSKTILHFSYVNKLFDFKLINLSICNIIN